VIKVFDELINSYEDQLALFEEIAFSQFSVLEDHDFPTFQDPDSNNANNGGIDSVVGLDESAFMPLNEQAFAELKLATIAEG
jgi:hypothetical protein